MPNYTSEKQNQQEKHEDVTIKHVHASRSLPPLPHLLVLAAVVTFWLYATSTQHSKLLSWLNGSSTTSEATPLSDNGLTDLVQWDKYSLFVKGQRVFLWSGEIHPWRIPVRSQWLDVLQKIKASGMNAISVYAHWGIHNPSKDVFNFEGWNDWQVFLDMAKAVGLWVVMRPGPYINAETTAGGIPGWVISETRSDLRSNNTDYFDAWVPYIAAISEITKRNQITEGGPVIAVQAENEYTSDPRQGPPFKYEMMMQLRKAFHDAGIVVPLTHNDAGMNEYFVDDGSVDLYGFDDYPQGFDCSHPYAWKNLTKAYHNYHMRAFPNSPLYLPEVQAGAFDPWGPAAPTYDKCRILTDSSFQNNLYYHMIASNAKMINLYMMYGGTSWGNIPFPGVYTSYDYGSAIRENRALSEKYDHVKLLGLFIRSVPELYQTDVKKVETLNIHGYTPLVITHLHNPVNKTSFYFIRHHDVSNNHSVPYNLHLHTQQGDLDVPLVYEHFTLQGRTTDLIITDLTFGNSQLIYTSASILFAGVMGGRDVLILHGDMSQGFESLMKLTGQPRGMATSPHISFLNLDRIPGHGTIVTFLPGIKGLIEVWDSDTQLIMYCDTETAKTFYAPVIAGNDEDFGTHWGVGTNSSILVGGPYLVRNATLENGVLALNGDIKGDTMLRLVGLSTDIKRLTWNGYDIEAINDVSESPSIWKGLISSPRLDKLVVPSLGSWKYHDSLPEIKGQYDDSAWIVANNFSTNCPYKPYFGDGPVLYACDYGFCEGAVIWRGTFDALGGEHGVRLVINGGEAFAASIWLNGHFLATTYGNSTRNMNIISETDEFYAFPRELLHKHKPNIVIVVQDNMGLDETGWPYDANRSKSPRGIRGYELLPEGQFTSWKVQGRLGGYQSVLDAHRSILNTGGFYGERQGWHLPGYLDSTWLNRELHQGLPKDVAGVGFFRTTFELDIPRGLDMMMSFVFEDETEGLPYRALLFVNGWHMGKRVANLGPQTKFIVHEGILNYHGLNTVAVVLWAMEPGYSVGPRLKLVVDEQFDGGAGAEYEPGPTWQDLFGEDSVSQ